MITSLRAKLHLQTVKMVLAVFVVVVLLGISVVHLQNLQLRHDALARLAGSSAQQANRLLPSLLLPEQGQGIGLLLDQFKEDEGLSRAAVFATEQEAISSFHGTPCEQRELLRLCSSWWDERIAVVAPVAAAELHLGFFYKEMRVEPTTLGAYWPVFAAVAAVLTVMLLGITWITMRLMRKEVPDAVQSLLGEVSRGLRGVMAEAAPAMFQLEEFRTLSTAIRQLIEEHHEARTQAAHAEVAAAVAHDIRSPIAALTAALATLTTLPPDVHSIVRSASGRINEIAADLLRKARCDGTAGSANFTLVLGQIVDEKRAQYQTRPGLAIDLRSPSGAALDHTEEFGVAIDPKALARLLSNLIDNAADAISDSGEITITLWRDGSILCCDVKDDGCGVPPEVLPTLMQKGRTFGKTAGSGLGLYYCKSLLDRIGGQVALESTLGRGTTVTLRIPILAPVQTTPVQILVPSGEVVTVDDDACMQATWRSILSKQGIPIVHSFDTTAAVTAAKASLPTDGLFLVDHCLKGEATTGLDLIERLGIQSRAVLVTSQATDVAIIDRCRDLGTRLLDKSDVPAIQFDRTLPGIPTVTAQASPIVSQMRPFRGNRVDALLIDDDVWIREAWMLSARIAGVELVALGSTSELPEVMHRLHKSTPIFLDSFLGAGEGVRGEDVAELLAEQGFDQIFMATGESSEAFAERTAIRAVYGKMPPDWKAFKSRDAILDS